MSSMLTSKAQISSPNVSVQNIVDHLFSCFDPRDAEAWDKVGLLVGDPCASVTSVGVALDATYETVCRAADAGCQALVTHHPLALELDFPILRRYTKGNHPQDALYHAIEHHVALIAMHTNLDRSPEAATAFAGLFGLSTYEPLEFESQAPHHGRLGQICSDCLLSVRQAAQAISTGYGSASRVFFAADVNDSTSHERVALMSGSFPSSLVINVINSGASLVITGEMGYHTALELQSAGVTVLLIGHDTSELIYSSTLTHVLSAMGEGQLEIVDCDAGVRWHTV